MVQLLTATLIQINWKTFELIAAQGKHYGACGERAEVAFHYLRKHPFIRDHNITVEMIALKIPTGNHAFILLNRSPSTDLQNHRAWNKECLYLDPYRDEGIIAFAKTLPRHIAVVTAAQMPEYKLEVVNSNTQQQTSISDGLTSVPPILRKLFQKHWQTIDALTTIEESIQYRGEPMLYQEAFLRHLSDSHPHYQGQPLHLIEKALLLEREKRLTAVSTTTSSQCSLTPSSSSTSTESSLTPQALALSVAIAEIHKTKMTSTSTTQTASTSSEAKETPGQSSNLG